MSVLSESGIVAAGGAIGSVARYWSGSWANRLWDKPWPWGTLAINIVGSFILGAFMAAALQRGWLTHWRLFVAVGFCGGFTTFSTFAAETVTLMTEGHLKSAFGYALLSVLLCMTFSFVGAHFSRLVFSAA